MKWQIRRNSGKGWLSLLSVSVNWVKNMTHDDFLAAGGTEKIVIFSKWALRELHLVNKHPFKIALEIRKGWVKRGMRMKNWKKWKWVRKDGGGWCKWKAKKWQGKDFLSYHKEESNQSVGFCVDDSTVAWLAVAQIGPRFVSQLGLFPRQGGCRGRIGRPLLLVTERGRV